MLTQEEKDEIINAAVERTLLAIPDVVGNLMANHAMLHKLNSEFYKKYKEFANVCLFYDVNCMRMKL